VNLLAALSTNTSLIEFNLTSDLILTPDIWESIQDSLVSIFEKNQTLRCLRIEEFDGETDIDEIDTSLLFDAITCNRTLQWFRCPGIRSHDIKEIKDHLNWNREFYGMQLCEEAYRMLKLGRLLAGSKPRNEKGVRLPFELLELIFLKSYTSHDLWDAKKRDVIFRAVTKRETLGKLIEPLLSFGMHELYHVSRRAISSL
jgi:hypothetical protein